ncbi:hypothetical protein EVAR_12982_1 [Eumeta japonica]|uniref:Uncharacterized protein n=1 Tax=Eumeta variegata TaxID=151549 RepID=A0A4C1TWU1_EUMVA|nr:hypothetical protein EVAR_12982_1 [Eumeta japonica]
MTSSVPVPKEGMVRRKFSAECHHCNRIIYYTAQNTLEACHSWAVQCTSLAAVIEYKLSLPTIVEKIIGSEEVRDIFLLKLYSKEIDASQAECLGRLCLSIVPRSRSHARRRRNTTMSLAFSEWSSPTRREAPQNQQKGFAPHRSVYENRSSEFNCPPNRLSVRSLAVKKSREWAAIRVSDRTAHGHTAQTERRVKAENLFIDR